MTVCRPASTLFLLFLLLAGLVAAPCAARRAHVDAPKATWEEFRPYLHANIAPYLKEDDFFVMVCTGATIKSVADPFDQALSDFAKVLLLQRAMGDERFATAVKGVTVKIRERVPTFTPSERERYREIFWEALDADPYVTDTIRKDYASAQAAGRVRCEICEKDPSFRPEGLREEVASRRNGLGR